MTGSETAPQITIYAQQHPVGTLTFPQPQLCEFHYTETWVRTGYPISPHISFSGEFSPQSVVRYIRNLFPEGSAFDRLLETENLSRTNIYAILQAIGNDTAGMLTFSPNVRNEGVPDLRHVTHDELADRLRNQKDMTYWDGKYRLSLAGVQNKLNVFINDQDEMFLASGVYASTHILKFASAKYPSIVVNELFCMRLANAVELPAAPVSLRKFDEFTALLVERFDRKTKPNGVQKRHIIDGCQALDMPPENKYEQNFGSSRDVQHIRDGVSLPKLFQFAKSTSVPIQSRQHMIDWVIFNLIIGNSDAHGKNISFYIGKREGITLAPFYDLVSVVYEAQQEPKLDTNLAMAIGDNFDITHITGYDLLSLAQDVSVDASYLQRRIKRLCQLVISRAEKLDFSEENLNEEQVAHVKALEKLVLNGAESLLEAADLFEQVRREAL
ncbi:HipA domain-containing protein [Aliidiomarina haloalkalitolerans]|uniref:HipA protein n=1 Tax=Aliidiomarina haloalkalitolerans TaxID=859059 RepID=A0A432VUR6_9GAMM|nr:HipA domain-containing protein [Aliidiomarina haloalkalitolerans]RUO20118.1 HipA protein [Aliidiomarina haloalkalitolerans]